MKLLVFKSKSKFQSLDLKQKIQRSQQANKKRESKFKCWKGQLLSWIWKLLGSLIQIQDWFFCCCGDLEQIHSHYWSKGWRHVKVDESRWWCGNDDTIRIFPLMKEIKSKKGEKRKVPWFNDVFWWSGWRMIFVYW